MKKFAELKPCPDCQQIPDTDVNADAIVLSCPRHGHEAQGQTLEQAVEHWNRYIAFVESSRKAA